MSSLRLTADARRIQILDVAVDVFGHGGYHGASMNDIADAAGVTKPVLYQHFDSKDDLYRALIDDVGDRMIAAITTATAEATNGREQTELGFLAYFRWVAQRHDEFMLIYGGGARHDPEFTDQLRVISDRAAQAIAPLIAVDLDPVMRETLAHGLIGLAAGASRKLIESGEPFDPDEVASAISSLAWAGLRSVSAKNSVR
ncbi:MAG TPA: TetR/AcrR family transcriptional regulator [Ilumatobacter sp.]|nr:TetR/AcrR family transcriptional regulator [Ilumatobacter sp.]